MAGSLEPNELFNIIVRYIVRYWLGTPLALFSQEASRGMNVQYIVRYSFGTPLAVSFAGSLARNELFNTAVWQGASSRGAVYCVGDS